MLGYRSSFSIYDQSDAVRLTDYVRRDLNLDPKRFPARQLHGAISALKNELVPPEEAQRPRVHARPSTGSPRSTASTSAGSLDASAVDFDDLLVLAVRLFREHPDVLARWRHASATCSSTSSRTRTSRSGSSCACSPRSTAT